MVDEFASHEKVINQLERHALPKKFVFEHFYSLLLAIDNLSVLPLSG